ncbi:MAG: histidinol-phosphate transaminase [Sulfobacillus acidophilus]|uniref:Histidinol-phosphate aminotransferase n=1 Tax=Sulfobacillus acidophilus TaxID=53633 RepID=A0A2T2WE43_9FIRM|nr:MAG: histidinol-phosphate transaminase [Sulfobacillus acidophilus]
MAEYVPGMSLRQARAESGREQLVKLASNESLWGPSPRALDCAHAALTDINYYPLVQESSLAEALSEREGIPAQNILVGNGADEILRLAAMAYVRPGDEVLYPAPSFSAYRHCTLMAGGTPVAVPLNARGANDLRAVVATMTEKTRLVYLCSPNNPTGTAFSPEEWDWYLDHVSDQVLTVVDGAYHEFCRAPSPDFRAAIKRGRPVLWVRTFSKLYGLAALRVGWGAASPEIVQNLMRVRDPFSVNSVGWAAAYASLQDPQYFTAVLAQNWAARDYLSGWLSGAGFSVFESEANFVTFNVPKPDQEVAQILLNQGFVVRPTTSFGLPGWIRITMAPQPIMEELVGVLEPLASG